MKVKLLYENNEFNPVVNDRETILEIIQKSDAEIIAPCGGTKKCGKCLVKTLSISQPIGSEEKKLLGSKKIKQGYRLACFIKAEDGMVVEIPDQKGKNKILTNSNLKIDSLDPAVDIVKIETVIPDLEKQTSDISNIMKSSGSSVDADNLNLLRSLTDAIKKSNNNPTVILYNDTVVGVENKKNDKLFGVSVDIGTTTVVAYLFDLRSWDYSSYVSEINDQKQFGADVISRINYANTEKDGLRIISKVIIKQLNEMIGQLCTLNNILRKDIYMISLAGNTTMMHLLMELDPINIGKLPFNPVSTEMHSFPAMDLGIKINKFGYALCLPSVSAYIGADIIAGLLACRLSEETEPALLIDIGTNGEIVLGNSKRMISCSTAAGPAFEGANIRFGTGGISGAIDTIQISKGKVVYTTIDDEAPIGICGSGIVDGVAELLRNNIVEDTGRFYDEDELEADPELADRIFEFEGMKAFKLTDEICITQKDVREIQNAKAAIAAGISTLIKKYGIKPKDVKKIFMAGGFGNYINIESAITIGLLPQLELENIIAVGNTAGAGAAMCLLSKNHIKAADELRMKVEYIELTTDPDFTNEYIENMMF